MEIGNRIKIVNYGHLIMFSKREEHRENRERIAKAFPLIGEDDIGYYYDMRPELVGREGVIVNKTITETSARYSIMFNDGNRISWFADKQVEAI